MDGGKVKKESVLDTKSDSQSQSSTQSKPVEKIQHVLHSDGLDVSTSNIGATVDRWVIKPYGATLPIKGVARVVGLEDANFSILDSNDESITYKYETKSFWVRKRYRLIGNHSFQSEIQIGKKISSLEKVSVEIFRLEIDISSLEKMGISRREQSLYEYSYQIEGKIVRRGGAYRFRKRESRYVSQPIDWIGFRDRYFCWVVIPDVPWNNLKIDVMSDRKARFISSLEIDSLKPGETRTWKWKTYVGPQKRSLLRKEARGAEEIMAFSRFSILNAAANGIYALLHFLYRIVPNWGVCIIIVSLLIYLAFFPLTMKGMRSMKQMQTLQPKINQLKEQYKGNPQKLNQEMMELYKRERINPLGGCLPLLFQMPIFLGLYQVLWRTVDFKGAQFLWIRDLSLPDRLLVLPRSFMIIGNEVNILPILMAVIMFFQQKFSMKNRGVVDPDQARQQRMMTILFPLFLGGVFYHAPSGLAIYFTMFYLMSTFTQWRVSKTGG